VSERETTCGLVSPGVAGRVKLVVTMPDVEPEVEAAAPSPRREKACQIWSLLAPPVSTWSADRMASRACTKLGLAGWSLRPSLTSFIARLLPPLRPGTFGSYPWAMLGLYPYLLMSSQFRSHSALHQSSPASCTSVLRLIPLTVPLVPKWSNVSGLMVMSKLYGLRRMPEPVGPWPRT
jgi:hypothetical protein